MNIWFLFFMVGMVTMIERLSFILLLDKWKMPDWFTRGLKYVPVAVLLSLVSVSVFRTDGLIDISVSTPKIIGAAVAIIVAWQTEKISATIGAGFLVFLVTKALM